MFPLQLFRISSTLTCTRTMDMIMNHVLVDGLPSESFWAYSDICNFSIDITHERTRARAHTHTRTHVHTHTHCFVLVFRTYNRGYFHAKINTIQGRVQDF